MIHKNPEGNDKFRPGMFNAWSPSATQRAMMRECQSDYDDAISDDEWTWQ